MPAVQEQVLHDVLHQARRSIPSDALRTGMKRMHRRQSSGSGSSTSYDHRWLLFLIPLILAFSGIVALVCFLLRRRQRKRQRRNSLRNVTLVVADEEKRQERLSRGNSLSSRVSRMASVRSTRSAPSRNSRRSSRRIKRTSIEEKVLAGTAKLEGPAPASDDDEEPIRRHEEVTNEILSTDCPYEISPAMQQLILGEHVNLESEAGDGRADVSETSQAEVGDQKDAFQDFGHRVRVRSGISIIGELPSVMSQSKDRDSANAKEQGAALRSPSSSRTRLPSALKRESSLRRDGSGVQRQSSMRSHDGSRRDSASMLAPSSTEHSSSNNPFTTPTPSSSGHVKLTGRESSTDGRSSTTETDFIRRSTETMKAKFAAVRSATPQSYEQSTAASGPGRPDPAESSSSLQALQRQESKRSSGSSGRKRIFPSSRRRYSAEAAQDRLKRAPSAPSHPSASVAEGPWTYTSRAAEWRAATATGRAPHPMSESNLPAQATDVEGNDGGLPPPKRPSAPIRRASVGVAGSRFIEALDDD